MRRKDLRIIGKLQELVVQALVEHGGKLLRGVLSRKIGTADVSNKQRVSGKYRSWVGRLGEFGYRNTDALRCVTGSRKKIEPALTELQGVTVFNRCVGEGSARALAEINTRTAALC